MPAGRPAFKPTQDQRKLVEMMAAVGITQVDIARAIGIDPTTLRVHFRDELDNGLTRCTTKVGASLVKQALDGNVTAAIFYLKTRGGDAWKERPHEHQHTIQGTDGLGDLELARRISFALAAAEARASAEDVAIEDKSEGDAGKPANGIT